MCSINTDSGVITYDTVRKSMDDEPYTMSLTGKDEVRAVIEAVNQGIDSHLESCFCLERGDRYGTGERKAGSLILSHTLECRVSVESFPVLLRRLFELDADDELMDAGASLGSDILMTLGFDESGSLVGREALGLE